VGNEYLRRVFLPIFFSLFTRSSVEELVLFLGYFCMSIDYIHEDFFFSYGLPGKADFERRNFEEEKESP
jgi:hypothetical protein